MLNILVLTVELLVLEVKLAWNACLIFLYS